MVGDGRSVRDLAYEALGLIAALVEEIDIAEAVDCDISEGAIKMEKDGMVYLVSWHEPSSQVWVASPSSGSVRFAYDEDKKLWIDEQGKGELMTFVREEASMVFGLSSR